MSTPTVLSTGGVGVGIAGRVFAVAGLVLWLGTSAAAQETGSTASAGDEKASAGSDGEENPSNPLASVNNTDLKYQYFDLGSDRSQRFLGSTRLTCYSQN